MHQLPRANDKKRTNSPFPFLFRTHFDQHFISYIENLLSLLLFFIHPGRLAGLGESVLGGMIVCVREGGGSPGWLVGECSMGMFQGSWVIVQYLVEVLSLIFKGGGMGSLHLFSKVGGGVV